MIAAARQAHAHDFVMGLRRSRRPETATTRWSASAASNCRAVSASASRSRACLLKNAPILVLDEATSALDSEIEAAIQENLQTLMDGKTVIAIAHRLSTIAAMDRLIVLDNGAIVETGTHQELLARGGIYASLWRRQSGGFLDAHAA